MIQLSDVTLRRGVRVLFEGATFQAHTGQRLGLVGANGSGKSSLFALLRGELETDAGEASISPGLVMAHVKQESPDGEQSALDYVLDGDAELRRVQAGIAAAEDGSALCQNELHALYESMERIDGYGAEARAGRLLHGLGFAADEVGNPVSSFSGGWRMRLNLAQALMCRSDILLLDEPTNHLDLEMRHALTLALAEFPGAMLLVSHDRHLLANTTDEFILVADGRAEPYDGDLDDYKQWLLSFKRDEKRRQGGDDEAGESPSAGKPVEDKKAQRRAAAALREQLKPLTNKLKSIEQKMAKAEKALAALETQLADEDLYSGGQQDEITRLTKAQGETRETLDALEMEWLEISEQLEEARGE